MKPTDLPTEAMLNDPALDAAHELVFTVLETTLALPGQQFPDAYHQLVDSIEADFRHEDQLMETFQCPDAASHRAQHARMLAGLHHAASALMQGDAQPARQALAALRDWLPFHIATQDRHLSRRFRGRGPSGARTSP